MSTELTRVEGQGIKYDVLMQNLAMVMLPHVKALRAENQCGVAAEQPGSYRNPGKDEATTLSVLL